jgi:signal transduction histidine kinase
MSETLTHDGQKSREKSDLDRDTFLAMVSHELRTPTTSILGWATLIRGRGIDEETLEHAVKAIERNARLQEQLIEQLLDYSRFNSGFLRLDARPASLVPIIEAATDTMLPLAKAKEIHLYVYLDASTGAVICDAARLQQVVTNLLANAIKFTPFGGRVDVRLERRGAYAEVTVRDTGQGIAAEFLPYIFDPFWQAGTNQATPHNGLGLGLAIARQIVEGHNGKIRAESQGEGKGTTFTISLPLMDEAAATNLQA